MEEEIRIINDNNTLNSKKISRLNIAIGGLAGGLILFSVIFYTGLITGSNLARNSLDAKIQNLLPVYKSQESSINQPDDSSNTYKLIRTYPSLNREFTFYVYSTNSRDKCAYGVKDKQGYSHDVSELLGKDSIICSEGQGNLSTSFVSWVDGNKFLVDMKNGEIKIVDVEKFEVETYRYDVSKYNFLFSNRTLDYWLFRKINQADSVSYILFDRNYDVSLDNINFDSNDRGVLYDEVNDGFLFISRTYSGKNVSIKFDFLPISNLNLRNVLITEPVETLGMGCYSEYLISQPREIILTPGCLSVSEKYLNSNGNIYIRL